MATTTITGADLRRFTRDDYVDALRDGRKQRATTEPSKKGKGSYRRNGKYGASW